MKIDDLIGNGPLKTRLEMLTENSARIVIYNSTGEVAEISTPGGLDQDLMIAEAVASAINRIDEMQNALRIAIDTINLIRRKLDIGESHAVVPYLEGVLASLEEDE